MTAKIRVMFLVGSLSTGGAERFVSNAVTHLDRARFSPYLALYRGDFSYPIAEDVEVNVLGKYRPWDNPRACLKLSRWIDEVHPDVLLSAWSVPNVFAAEALRWSRHKPFWIARVANNPSVEESGLYGYWARASYRKANAFIAVCQGIGEAFADSYPFTKGRVEVLYNSVDIEGLKVAAANTVRLEPEGAVHLVAAGRLHRQKRYDVMLRALAEARTRANVHLHVLGAGEEEAALRRLADELGISGAVTWHGFQDNLYPFYATSDIFVLTSDYEGLSNALLEAQGLGLPAVVTDCPYGNAEVVKNGDTGFVCPIGDAEAIAQQIVRLAKDPGQRKKMGEAAHLRVTAHFSLGRMVQDLECLIEEQAFQGLGEATARPEDHGAG